jgi:calcineurin-like phosphoesterase family protein
MGRKFYTADLHLGHEKVARLRGFATAEEHDEAIAAKWRDAVRTEDTVWILGDLALASTANGLRRILDMTAQLSGRKHLVAGNHDPVHPMHRNAHRWQLAYLRVFESVQPFARHVIGHSDVLLSHFPYSGDHTKRDRHVQYRLRDEGRWLLHGHTHAMNRRHSGHQIHVGLEGWDLLPASDEAIEALINERPSDPQAG